MSDLKYTYTFDPEADNNTATSIARFALLGGPDVLDIGSGPAWVSRYLAGEHGRTVTCLDYDIDALRSLADTGLTAYEADLEAEGWDKPVAGQQFDVVIIADVLEHLREPGKVLERLREASLMREDGFVIISVPNASHQSVVAELLHGDFRYTEAGLLDETHVRWFTLENLTRMLERSGFVVDRVERTLRPMEHASLDRTLDISPELRREIRQLNDESMTYQFVVLARPDTAANRMAAQRDAFEADRAAWAEERRELIALIRTHERDKARVVDQLKSEQEYMRREFAAGARELETQLTKLESLRRRAEKWKGIAADRDRRIQRLEAQIGFYRGSRLMRLCERIVRKARRIRSRR